MLAWKLLAKLRSVATWLLPQPIQYLVSPDIPQPSLAIRKRPTVGTAWMDGFRGFSSILILWIHMLEPYGRVGNLGWHNLRLFYFVISGYAISSGYLKTLSAGKVDLALSKLSASAFRRFFRIYVPVLVTFLLIGILSYAGAYDSLRPYFWTGDHSYFSQAWTPLIPQRYSEFSSQLWHVYGNAKLVLNVYDTSDFFPELNAFLWTIRPEFRGSMILILSLLVFARLKAYLRMLAFLCIILFAAVYGRWEVILCMLGASVAQAEVIVISHKADNQPPRNDNEKLDERAIQLPSSPNIVDEEQGLLSYKTRPSALRHSHKNGALVIAWIFLYCFSIYLMAFPTYNHTYYPSYGWIWRHFPSWWQGPAKTTAGIGAALFIVAMSLAPTTSFPHRIFNNGLGQYLGTRFFGILAMSWVTLCSGGYWLPDYAWRYLGGSRMGQGFEFWRGFLPAALLNILLSIWTADLWTRTIDTFAVELISKIVKYSFVEQK